MRDLAAMVLAVDVEPLSGKVVANRQDVAASRTAKTYSTVNRPAWT